MVRWVALLRGINVGRSARVAMADLRAVATGLGWAGVRTHLQSGNVVFDAPADADPAVLAARLTGAVQDACGVLAPVVVLSGAELTALVAGCPFAAGAAAAPRTVHLAVLSRAADADAAARVADARARSAAAGSPDRAVLDGRALWLETPGGVADSDLATRLTRAGGLGRGVVGTARNATTLDALIRLVGEPPR